MRYILIFILFSFSVKAQVKFTQIERAATKFHLPIAQRIVPGVDGFVMQYGSFLGLLDSLNLELGTKIISMSYGGDTLKLNTSDGLFYAVIDTTVTGGGTVTSVTASSPLSSSGGSNPNISIATASGSLTGALTSTDWNTFNSKISGSGTTNYVPKWTGSNTLSGTSLIFDNGTSVGVNNTSPSSGFRMDVSGRGRFKVGSDNLFLGGGNTSLSGNSNVALGESSLSSITSGSQNFAGGVAAIGSLTTGDANFALGYQSQYSNISGSQNISIGNQSLYNNTTGSGNIAIGGQALANAKNDYSIAIGYGSLASENASGYSNTAIGYASGNGVTSGNRNTIFGYYALGSSNGSASLNTAIGHQAGKSVTGNGNIFLGFEAAKTQTSISNQLWIDNEDNTAPLIGGDFANNRLGINILPSSTTQALHVVGNERLTGAFYDKNNDPGTAGQVLSSTVSGTDWIDNSTVGVDTVKTKFPVLGGPIINVGTVSIDTTSIGGMASNYDLSLKQNTLISGTNIKTVNGSTLLGSGNLSVGTVTSVSATTPLAVFGGGSITSSGSIGLNYNSTTMGILSGELTANSGSAIWNANSLRGTSIGSPFSPSSGQVLKWNGTNWLPGTDNTGIASWNIAASGTPGTGSVTDGTTVTFQAGTGMTTTRSATTVTYNNAGVTSFNGNTGAVNGVSTIGGSSGVISLGSGLSMSSNTLTLDQKHYAFISNGWGFGSFTVGSTYAAIALGGGGSGNSSTNWGGSSFTDYTLTTPSAGNGGAGDYMADYNICFNPTTSDTYTFSLFGGSISLAGSDFIIPFTGGQNTCFSKSIIVSLINSSPVQLRVKKASGSSTATINLNVRLKKI